MQLANVTARLLASLKGHRDWGRCLANGERQMSHLYSEKGKRTSQGTIDQLASFQSQEGHEASPLGTNFWAHEREKGD